MSQVVYLVTIVASFSGMVVIDRRWRLGVLSRRLVAAILVVEAAFLAFDLVGASRGWFASEPDRVVAIIPPGIPLEEPLLLAFLATFTIVLYRIAERALGDEVVGRAGGRRSDDRRSGDRRSGGRDRPSVETRDA